MGQKQKKEKTGRATGPGRITRNPTERRNREKFKIVFYIYFYHNTCADKSRLNTGTMKHRS